jgi:hypothetical protein
VLHGHKAFFRLAHDRALPILYYTTLPQKSQAILLKKIKKYFIPKP